jgi:hypothetical protein
MIDFKNATFKYLKQPFGLVDKNDTILVTQTGYVITVPMSEQNADYLIIKEKADAGEITIEEAD